MTAAMTGRYAEALFCSPLQCSERPSAETVRAAVIDASGLFGPVGCAGRVAQEFGDHPECARDRMCWCLDAVREAFVTAGAR